MAFQPRNDGIFEPIVQLFRTVQKWRRLLRLNQKAHHPSAFFCFMPGSSIKETPSYTPVCKRRPDPFQYLSYKRDTYGESSGIFSVECVQKGVRPSTSKPEKRPTNRRPPNESPPEAPGRPPQDSRPPKPYAPSRNSSRPAT